MQVLLGLVAGEVGLEPATHTVRTGEIVIAVKNVLDIEHTFVIPDLGIEETMAPGETTVATFETTEPGTYAFEIADDLAGSLDITEQQASRRNLARNHCGRSVP
ncbi:MAG: cupredoxin domain-containing protein [Chloroflexi bacterium]|nr:cupredoxin domain-containing protein [Chloroflexota bacterium]